MSTRKILNGKIENTTLLIERGSLTCYLFIDHEEGNQAFGGWSFGSRRIYDPKDEVGNFGSWFITRLLTTFKVNAWEDLINTPIRISIENEKIISVGNYYKDEWFEPAAEIENLKKG
jgi:hypothetical protein